MPLSGDTSAVQRNISFHRVVRHKKLIAHNVFDRVDTTGVIQRVARLFHAHPSLIQGFNTFLPVGYRVEVGSDVQSSGVITIMTPSGAMSQPTNTLNTSLLLPRPATRPQEPGQLSTGSIGVSSFDYQERQSSGLTVDYHGREGLGPAMDYVQRIKTRFSNDPDTYKQFLEIIASHKSSTDNVRLC